MTAKEESKAVRRIRTGSLELAIWRNEGENRAQLYEIVEMAMRRRTCRASCWRTRGRSK